MPESNANLGYQSKFGIKGGSTYTYVAEVTSLTPPGWTRDTVDVTHLESPDMAKEFIGGLIEADEATISINYVPSATDSLLAAFTAGRGEYRVLFPSGTVALDFKGIVTGYEMGDLVADDKMTATFTVKPSGKPALVTVTP